MKPYFGTPEYRKLIRVINEYGANTKYKKYYEHISDFLLADYRLSSVDWENQYSLDGYTYFSPYMYETEEGPQTYYDYKEDFPIPTGLCVAFCFVYLMLRMNCNTKNDFLSLQSNINEQFYTFLFQWYQNNVDSSITLSNTDKDKKIFVRSAIVEFIVTANDKYYKELFDDINDRFKTNFLSTGGRTFFM
jgi:hypothetical protein